MSNLPGSIHAVAAGSTCDECANSGIVTAAVVRCQGDTDSFGAEYSDLCAKHKEEWDVEAAKPIIGRCDWCRTGPHELSHIRDSDEGSSGPVYLVCHPCISKMHSDDAKELAWMDRDQDD